MKKLIAKNAVLSASVLALMPIAAHADWTGYYVGLNAGAAGSKIDNTLTIPTSSNTYFYVPAIPGVEANGSFKHYSSNFTGGVQFGFNRQINNVVLGYELDVNALHASASRNGPFLYTTNHRPYELNTSVKSNWLATARLRLGYAPSDAMLWYLTGGLALGSIKFSQSFSEPIYYSPTLGLNQTSRKMLLGTALGVGLEYAIANQWSIKAEYLYIHFNHSTISYAFNNSFGKFHSNNRLKVDDQILRIGLNYRF